MKLLLNIYGGEPSDPLFQLFGLILIVVMITLIIRLRKKQRNKVEEYQVDTVEMGQELFIERDVLGFEKVSTSHKVGSYRAADKAKLKYLVYVLLIIVGMFMIVLNTTIKKGPFEGASEGGVIHHPEVFVPDYYYQDVRKEEILDSNLNFKEKDVF